MPLHHGQANRECGPLRFPVVETDDLSAVLAHNPVADAQSQPSSFANLLGCEERIEDALGISDASSVIAKVNLDQARTGLGRDHDSSATPSLSHGIAGV